MRWCSWAAGLIALSLSAPVQAQESFGPEIMANANRLVAVLKDACPIAAPDNQEAFDRCRKALYESQELAALFAPDLQWGGAKPDVPVWELKLTHFDSTLFRSLYLPLFMFDGGYTMTHEGQSSWVRLKLHATFRNGLALGQFPYPFWHTAEKWQAYQELNELIFRLDPATAQVWTVLRQHNAGIATVTVPAKPAPVFDGKWMWQGQDRSTQPAVTLYDGLFDSDNPFKASLAVAYQDFALSLRDKSCLACHNPGNPAHMKQLVLLQTPAHAAGEIRALIAAVEKDQMPLTEWGIADPMTAADKAAFLAKARAFQLASERAFAWENSRR